MQKLRRRAASEQHLKHQIAQCDVPSFERSDFPFSVTARGPLVRSVSPRAANQRSGARASAISRYKRVVSFSQMTTAAFSSGRKMLSYL
jgi:hypothetical protein